MSGFPKDYKKTGTKIAGVELAISEAAPNCKYSMIMSARTHRKTGEIGWYAFCKKTGELDKFGPYKTIYDAIHALILTKGCDECKFNEDESKETYLQRIDDELEEQIKAKFGTNFTRVDRKIIGFYENRLALDILFERIYGARFFISVPDDNLGALDLINPCSEMSCFVHKIEVLAGMFDRINHPGMLKLLAPQDKSFEGKSIGVVEQFLKEKKTDYKKSIISNLKNLMSLRNKLFPTHVMNDESIKILNNFGIDRFPPDNWDATFLHIFDLVSSSQTHLLEELLQIAARTK